MFCPFLENREEEKMINKLVAKIKETKAPIVVGLDPMLNYIPEHKLLLLSLFLSSCLFHQTF